MHTMKIMGKEGHREIKWTPEDRATISVAEAEFNNLIGNGGLAYALDTDSSGRVLKHFNPTDERVVLHPRMVGG